MLRVDARRRPPGVITIIMITIIIIIILLLLLVYKKEQEYIYIYIYAAGLLEFKPRRRAYLGESCFGDDNDSRVYMIVCNNNSRVYV